MANQTITQLPTAQALTGTELVPIVQGGGTVKTTVADIAATPVTNYSFVTATSEGSLSQSRQLTTSGNGLTLTDNGPGSTLVLSLSGAAASLVAAGTGIQVKTSATTLTGRSIAAGTAGLSVADGDGVAGNPIISLSGIVLNLAQSSGVGLLTRTSGNSIGIVTLQGTANEIDVANGTGNGADPTVGLADNPVVPGNEGLVVPSGTTGQRPSPATNGTLRYNSTAQIFEGYANGAWGALATGGGVASVAMTVPSFLSVSGSPITSAGTLAVSYSGTPLPTANGGTALTTTPTDGQLLIGNGTGYTLATLTAGSNVTITNSPGGITIASTGGGGGGDVVGPSSSTDNAIARFDGTTGKLIQNSVITIEDDGSMVIPANSTNAGLRITQTGSGSAILVEDSANPDATPFVVTASGLVGIGTTSPATGFNYDAPSGDAYMLVRGDTAARIHIRRAGDNVNAPAFELYKARGTYASPTIVSSGDRTADIRFQGYDGTQYLATSSIISEVDGTPGTNDMPGRLIFSTTADGASSPTERMRIDSSGAVGIGAAPSGIESLVVSRNISGAVTSYGINNNGVVQSGVTTAAYYFVTSGQTAAASFTLGDLMHYRASQGTFGAGSTVTNQYGFIAAGNLTGATNNYGFYSNIAAGTGRWNFYAAGTAQNSFAGNVLIGSGSSSPYGKLTVLADRASIAYNTVFSTYNGASFENDFYIGFNGTVTNVGNYQSFPIAFVTNNTERMRIDSSGNVGIGTTASAGTTLQVQKTLTGSVNSYNIYSAPTNASDVTNTEVAYLSVPSTGFAVTNVYGYWASQGTFTGAVTNQMGFHANSSLTGATNNFGFYSNIASGTGRWNFYANGTASNYFGGNTIISVTDNTNAALRITQTGTGDAILVEDSANPDSSPFVVDASGVVGIGTTTPQSTFSLTAGIGIQSTGAFTPQIVQRNKANDSSASYFIAQKDRAGAIVQSGDAIGNIVFQAFDGASMLDAARITAGIDGTPGTNDMPGRLTFLTTADGASSPTERMRIDNSGRVAIGTVTSDSSNLRVFGLTTGNVNQYGVLAEFNAQSGVTNAQYGFTTSLSTQAASFTLTNLRHFAAAFQSIGASSTVTNQVGFFADGSLTGATNNFGFYSNIASGTGRWNFYAAGTAQNYFAGTTLIGTTTNTNSSTLVVNGTISQTVSGTQYLVVDQSDIGTGANEIPLNQYLGANAYVDTETPALNIGTGITTGTGTICRANGGLSGGIYRMTILIDLTGLNSGGTAGDIIGVNGTALPCYIAQLPAMTVLGGRMTCLETPAGGDTDIDLYSATEGTGVEDQAITALTETQIINAGAQTRGTVTYFSADPVTNEYFYFVGQGVANATYTAGRFLIEIFGVQ